MIPSQCFVNSIVKWSDDKINWPRHSSVFILLFEHNDQRQDHGENHGRCDCSTVGTKVLFSFHKAFGFVFWIIIHTAIFFELIIIILINFKILLQNSCPSHALYRVRNLRQLNWETDESNIALKLRKSCLRIRIGIGNISYHLHIRDRVSPLFGRLQFSFSFNEKRQWSYGCLWMHDQEQQLFVCGYELHYLCHEQFIKFICT